jgi:hypothetical protein
MMKFKLNCGLVIALCLSTSVVWADSLELKNGSLIKGKFMGGTESEINFQVGSTVQRYNLTDIVSLRFDSDGSAGNRPTRSDMPLSGEPGSPEHAVVNTSAYVIAPVGTRISVRTIDGIDSTQSHAGDRQVARGEYSEENRRRSGGRIDHRRHRWRWQRGGDRRGRWCRGWGRVGNYHQGRPGKGAERDPTRFHAAAGCVDTDAPELICASRKSL